MPTNPGIIGAPLVVPLDGSSNAENAVPLAVLLAQAFACPVQFLHVTDDAGATESERSRNAEAFRLYVAKLTRGQGLEGSSVDVVVASGEAAAAIVAAGDVSRAIVLASHGRGGFRAAVIGSVADRVVRSASRPVFLVRGTQQAQRKALLGRIVVALDGSADAEHGLEVAREVASRTGARITLVRSYQAPVQVADVDFLYYDPEKLEPRLQAEAETYLAAMARPGEDWRAEKGPAAETISEFAGNEGADLLVLSTRGLNMARRLFLGSVTDKVIRLAKCPLLVVPPGLAEETSEG